MARFIRITREQGIDYLLNNENWRELARNNRRIKSPRDMDTATIRRYANRLRVLEGQGKWAHDLGELRGHTASEHHKGRGRKSGYENWTPPERIPRMYNASIRFAALDRRGARHRREAKLTVTAGESVAVRALNQAIQDGNQVALSLSGPLPGEHRFIFWKGGYNPRLLLAAAGYKPTRKGRYVRVPGTLGLERWVINYLANLSGSPTKSPWAFISLYQIYATKTIGELDLAPPGRPRTYYTRDFHRPDRDVSVNPWIVPTSRPSLTGRKE